MKKVMLIGLILTSVGMFSNGAWARCCSGGERLCYPKCLVETESGGVNYPQTKNKVSLKKLKTSVVPDEGTNS